MSAGAPQPDLPGIAWFESAELTLTRDADGVALLRLHSPPANEIGLAVLGALEHVLALMAQAPPKALVIASDNPHAFSAGADLRELHRELEGHLGDGGTIEEGQARVAAALARLHTVMDGFDLAPYPTVAAISGVCMGGGFELALTADLRVCDKSARFAFPELRLGLIPGWGGTARLAREGGPALLRDLLLTGRTLGATRAFELGLVQSPLARGEALPAALRMARQAGHFSRPAMLAAKRMTKALPEGALEDERRTFVSLFSQPAVREALARFASSTDVRPYL